MLIELLDYIPLKKNDFKMYIDTNHYKYFSCKNDFKYYNTFSPILYV